MVHYLLLNRNAPVSVDKRLNPFAGMKSHTSDLDEGKKQKDSNK